MATLTLQDIRQQYPQYNDLSDRELAGKLHERFYSDMPRVEFDRRIGVTPETWGEYAGGLARQAIGQGALLGFGDEGEAAIRAAAGRGTYGENVERIRRENEQFSREHPIASTAANLVGGAAPFVAGPGAAVARMAIGSTLPRTVARSAAFGGGVGGVAGFGAGEGGVEERLPSAALGAGLGAGLGAVVPPVVAGASRALDVAGRMVSPRSALGRRAASQPPGEPPVPPQGAQYEPGGQQAGRIQFIDDRADASLGSMDRAVQVLTDQATRMGISREEALNRIARYYAHRGPAGPEAFRYHTNSYGPSASTLVEIFPEFAETLGAAARQNPQVHREATQFFTARQSGITPQDISQRALAERGVPTRPQFAPPVRSDRSAEELGRQFGPPSSKAPVAMGMRERVMEHVKRMLQISDNDFHGHAATPEEHLPQIIAAQRANAQANYTAAMDWADQAGVNLSPALKAVMEKWTADPEMKVRLFRVNLRKIAREFIDEDTGQPVSSLRSFDTAKKAADDLISDLHGSNLGNVGGKMTEFKNDLLKAVDDATGGEQSLYRQARNMFSSESESRDIMTAYRDLVKGVDPNVRFEPGLEHFNTLSAENQKLAKAGLMWGFRDMTKGTDLNRSVVNLFNTPRVNELIQRISPRSEAFGPETLGRFLAMEDQGRRAYQTALGGSQTARNMQSDATFEALQAFGNMQQTLSMFRGSTGILDAGARIFQRIIERSFGITADSARDLGRMLLTADPSEQMRIIQRIAAAMPADRMARFTELMQSFTRYASTPGIATSAGQAGAQQSPQQPTFL